MCRGRRVNKRRAILLSTAVALHLAGAAAAQSRSAAEMPDAILKAQISRPTPTFAPVWIASISPGGYISATGTLRDLIQIAYRQNLLDRPRVEGGPGWIGDERFSINLQVPGSEVVGDDGFPRGAMAA